MHVSSNIPFLNEYFPYVIFQAANNDDLSFAFSKEIGSSNDSSVAVLSFNEIMLLFLTSSSLSQFDAYIHKYLVDLF